MSSELDDRPESTPEPTDPEIRALEAEFRALESSILLARATFLKQAGVTFGGDRDEYQILGYDRQISNKQYRDEYHRGGIAGRVVDVMPDACWRGDPAMELIEDEDPEVDTAFEKAWKQLDTRLQICAKLQRTDRLARLGNYAALLIGAPGDLSKELPQGKPEGLLYLMPFAGGGGPAGPGGERSKAAASDADCTIGEYDTDPSSSRFGLPLSYQLKRTDISSSQLARTVHWTRIIHVAEGLLDDEVFGQPALERVWNLLIDLRKVTGGGAEAFWLRANAGLHVDVDKDLQLDKGQYADVIEKLKAQSELYKHQLTRWLQTRGVNVQQLGSDVANFANPAEAIITQIAGSKAIPKRILMGSEMGELASSQDRENFKDQINGRQTQYCGPYIARPLADRLIKYGYLLTPAKGPQEYKVWWPHIQVMTEQEKATGAKDWAAVNQTYGDVVYTDAEIREHWSSMEPLTDEQRQEIADHQKEKLEMQAEAMAAMAPSEEGAPADPKDPKAIVDQLLGDKPPEDDEKPAKKKVIPFKKLKVGEDAEVRTADVKPRGKGKWDESKHSRGRGEQGGEFVSSGGDSGGESPAPKAIKDVLTEEGGKFEPGDGRSEAVIPHTDASLAAKTADAVASRLTERGYKHESTSAGKQVLVGPNARATISVSPDNKVTVTVEKTSTAHALPPPDEKVALKLADHRDTLPAAEKAALNKGFKEAQTEGFKGDIDQFFAEQLALYQHAKEGDPRLKTWFGETADDILEDEGVKKYIDGLIKAQGAPVKEEKPRTVKEVREETVKEREKVAKEREKAKSSSGKKPAAEKKAPEKRPAEADLKKVTPVIDLMDRSERHALEEGFDKAVAAGEFDDTEYGLEAFLLSTYHKYQTESEEESTAGTWLSEETMSLLKKTLPKVYTLEAGDEEILRVLEAAILTNNVSVIHQIIGLGGPGSGHFGHAGRPGEVGGSASEGVAAAVEERTEDKPTPSGSTPESREKAHEEFHRLKDAWAAKNDELFRLIDKPDSPEALQKLDEMKVLAKAWNKLDADPGGLEGIGLPGGPKDIVIIGAGPGGLAASVMAGAEGYDTLLIEANPEVGGQSRHSSRVENFPGFPMGISGEKLAKNMHEQSQRLGTEERLGVKVTGLSHNPETGLKTLTLSNGETVEARSVIVAGGLEFRAATFPGSDSPNVVVGDPDKLMADAAGKAIAVAGGSNGAAQAALMAAVSAQHVTLVARRDIKETMSDYQVTAVRSNKKITVMEHEEISGWSDGRLGLKSGKSIDAAKVGVFFGSEAKTGWLPTNMRREGGKLITSDTLETDVPGVFAVGDVRAQSTGRIGIAVGEGQLAIHSIFEHFDKLKKKAKG